MNKIGNQQPFKAFLERPRYATSQATREGYSYDLGMWMAFLATRKVKDVLSATQDDCEAAVRAWREKKTSDVTIGRRMACMRQAYKFWLYKKLITADPTVCFAEVKLAPKMKTNKGLSKEQREHVEASLKYYTFYNHRISLFTLLGFKTGLRLSEKCRLAWEDINFEKGELVTIGKGNKKAMIIVSPNMIKAFKEYQALEEVKKANSKWVFFNQYDYAEHLSKSWAGKFSKEVAKWAGFGKDIHYTDHSLRHSLCGQLIDSGVSIEVTQDAMRHSNPATTMGYYRLVEDKKRKEMNRVIS